MNEKKLILIRGPLGVGKTAVAKKLGEKLNAEYISLDKLLADHKLETDDGIPLENFLRANEIISHLIKVQDKTYIVDGCFYYKEQLDDLKSRFPDLIIFTLYSDVEKCIERDSKREKVYGEDAARFVYMMTSKVKAGYEIDNSDLSLDETLEKVLEKCPLLLFE